MFLDIIAATGWTIDQILDHTYPQLLSIYKNKSRLVYPQVKPILEYIFGKGYPDEKSVDKYVREKESQIRLARQGMTIKPTYKEAKRKRAWDFFVAEYLGLPDENTTPHASPIKILSLPLSRVAAQSIISWLKEDDGNACPSDVWIDDVMPIHPSIMAILSKE